MTARRYCHQSDHFVQSHTAIDDQVLRAAIHIGVHLLVHQSESNRLIAHHSLVVALGVCHRAYIGQAVGHNLPNLPHIPLLIGYLLQEFDPKVGDSHTQTIVESDTAIVDLLAHTRHTAHVLGNGYSRRAEVVNQSVGESEVCNCRSIDRFVEELLARIELGVTVVVIEHRGHAVETETVKVELVEPIFEIREQEVLHLGFRIIENHRIPIFLVACLASGRVVVVATVQFAQTLVEVLDIVSVNDVHNHSQSHRVSRANQLLQFLGCAESARRSIEIRNVITERAVVGVLGNGHQLHSVVACTTNLGQNLARKFAVSSHIGLLLRHTHVSLVDQ